MNRDLHGLSEGPESRGQFRAAAFGRQVQRLTSNVRSVMGDPGCTPDELITIHERVFRLLVRVSFTRTDPVVAWLLDVRQEVGAKLQAWAEEDLGVRVA